MQHASDCYTFHFGAAGHSNEDIGGVVAIPKVDLVVGGFPCQDYSVAKARNASEGISGKKGVLWWDIHRIVSLKKPRFVFLENVDRLLKSPVTQKGRDFAIMLSTLGSLGYLIEWRVINAADYGFPQRRIRTFIVATRTKKSFRLTQSVANEAILSSGVLARSLEVSSTEDVVIRLDLSAPPEELSRTFGSRRGSSPFLNSGVFFDGIAFTVKTTPRELKSRSSLEDILVPTPEVPKEFWIGADRVPEWTYLKGAKSIARTHKESGVTYKYAEGRMAFPDHLDKPARTILTGEGGPSPSRFKHVIRVGRRYRRLLPIELERLNGFPDDWTAFGIKGQIPDSRRAFLMGNALVVGLVERVGKVLAEDLQLSRGPKKSG